jgi:hypothetical protein
MKDAGYNEEGIVWNDGRDDEESGSLVVEMQ